MILRGIAFLLRAAAALRPLEERLYLRQFAAELAALDRRAAHPASSR